MKEYKTTEETNIYTFDIADLYTMIPQKEAVLAVCEFLGRHGYRKVHGLAINTIKAMFLHVLEHSYFVLQLPGLEPKFYQQIRGGAMGSACTQVLADIYVRKWESDFVKEQHRQGELYFRFRDDVFFITALAHERIEQILSELNNKDPNLNITWEGGKTVDYLDVTIITEIPNFRTRVFRKLAAQPYVLPFHSSHPPHITKNIPYAAVLRATRICSHTEDLRCELDKIRIMLLLNKYPPKFIDKQIERFFQDVTGKRTSDLLLGEKHPKYRERVLKVEWNKKEKRKIEFGKDILLISRILHLWHILVPGFINYGRKYSKVHHSTIYRSYTLTDYQTV